MDQLPILNEGIHQRVEVTPQGITSRPLKFSQTATFEELSKEFTFYTPALLMLYSNLPFNPVEQFYAIKNLDTKPYIIVTDEPLFHGLTTKQTGSLFDHFLMAIENHLWKEMALHLGTIGIKDSNSNTFFGTLIQKLPMADYLALRHYTVIPNPVPIFDIYAVALDGNKACMHFIPAVGPPIDKIKLLRSPPNQNVVDYVNAIFKGIPR